GEKLQRVGRAGHSIGETSKGRIVVFEKDDLVECTALTHKAYQHDIDRVSIPENNYDVLAQTLIGMSIPERWDLDEAYEMATSSYCYKDMSKEDFLNVLDYLGGTQLENMYPKIWYNEDEGTFGKKKGVQMLYYMNVGTIPSDSSYRVYSEKGVPLGNLSEKFVERLSKGDVFILGSNSYEFLHTRGTKVFVKDAAGKKPTVPSWSGEMLPRSYDLSVGIGEFRRKLSERLEKEEKDKIIEWLKEEYRIDEGSAQTIISYFKEQKAVVEDLPTDRRILVEGHTGQDGNHNLIFHACFGRKTNDALSRAYAYKISKKFNCNANVAVTDDNFMITTKKKIPLDQMEDLLSSDEIGKVLKKCVRNTELFKQRFRHCAERSLMILRNYKGREISVSKQKARSEKLLNRLHQVEDFPIIKETYNEILYQVLNLEKAEQVLKDIEGEKIAVETEDYSDTPSPFAHSVLMTGVSDVIMMEDRSSLLRQFHQKVLEEAIPKEEIEKFKFDSEVVKDHFMDKRPDFDSKQEMLEVIEELEPIHVFKEKGRNVFTRTDRSFEEVRSWAKELLNEGKIQSLWAGEVKYILTEDLERYLYSFDQGEQPHGSTPIIERLEEGEKTRRELYEDTELRLKEVKEILRDMERKRLVSRTGVTDEGDHRYSLLEKKDRELESLEDVILDHLKYEAPVGLEEISYRLDVPEDIALKALNNLVEQNTVVSGRLVMGEGEQYMTREDYHELRFPSGEHISNDKVQEYKAQKQFGQVGSIEEYFELFMEAGTPYDIYHRVSDFSIEEWRELRKEDRIIEGRFIKGKVRYALKDDLPKFVGAYRTEELNEKEEEILNIIERGRADTLREIKNYSDLKNEDIKEIVKKLDRNLNIRREFTGKEGWSSTNKYTKVDVEPLPEEEAKEEIIKGYLKGNGPASFSSIRYFTGFKSNEIEDIISELLHQREIKKLKVGNSQREMYVEAEEVKEIQETKGDEYEKLRILSKRDPYSRPLWADIYRRYGDDWVFPLIKEGEVVGGIEKWKMSGCIEIRHLDVEDESLVPEVIYTLDDMMDFHRLEGYDIIRIKNFQNRPVEDLPEETISPFLENGYKKIQGMLVKGNIVEDVFEKEKIRSYVFKKQRLGGNGYRTPMKAIEGMKGTRSDLELRPRVEEYFSLEWMYKRGKVMAGKMIPPYHMYASPEQVSVYKAAKDLPMDSERETILEIILDKEPTPKRTIYHLSPYSRGKTKEIINELYEGLVITRDHDGRYIPTPEKTLDSRKAKKKIIRWTFENFGIFTAEKISAYLGLDYSMREIRKFLAELVDEGFLSKGFLVEGDDSVYWVLIEDLDGLSEISFDSSGVITKKDRLNLYFRKEIKERFDLGTSNVVFDGPKLKAAFEASIKSDTVSIKEFEGDEEQKKTIKEWAYEQNMGVKSEKKKEKKVSDYEIRKWYEKTRGI
ncbi:MAG: hypothetical protein KGY76_08935, partial [Candidatus Thermoplasmatota archaeon]|nr:hypothetical protein [Candidatus Thermoplasmatota archaeon]